mmetsp:Transcript_41150/g.42047  ORF Transcript_41150/g.42047 Transcript_41150/m.42047 type:complete len:216 (-) Transcript_41150:62-709(-)|eukprot:CAMPEP_0182429988 /NCGR_PEP_ID=MMETSP1167-20130531/35689_1 /TAXON_ID=2988 /ORGANISM="Mallomonas Sp, Strain CCMP3275" /LENGTH=215 /DNA_ID=CAMNT_0024614473 /DNA_START=107 /DNA_END=754 /DNA_ORIENTATION=+
MPRSKRNKVVSLTKTTSKGRQLKTKLVDSLRGLLDEYSRVFVFRFQNLRATKLKDVRMQWRESRIFLGKNTVARKAFGNSVEEEYKDNLHSISERLTGNVGILFTNRSKEEVIRYFDEFEALEYAKAGVIPEETINIPEGPLDFPVSMLDQFRKLGLVVEIEESKVILQNSFTVATAGVPLSPEQAKMLVHLKQPIEKFRLQLECYWSEGEFEEL